MGVSERGENGGKGKWREIREEKLKREMGEKEMGKRKEDRG